MICGKTSLVWSHSPTAVKQAMMQSLKGQALMVTSALPPETSWENLLQALKIKYQDKAPYDVLMAQFYETKIEPDETCASFGTRLEQKLNQVSLQYPNKYPNKISESMYWNCVRERFFHGLPKDMRTNLRTQFDSGANFVNTQGSRGGRGGYRGRGGRGRGRGGPILCYWCRDFLPKEQASHKIAQCPYQKQAKDSWWKNQLGNTQGETSAPQLENKEN